MAGRKSKVAPPEKLLEKVGSAYKLVVLASKRAVEISNGSPKLVEAHPKRKAGIVALEEIAQGKVRLKASKGKK